MDERYREALKEKTALEGLQAHPGWLILRSKWEAQATSLEREVLTNTVDREALYRQEFVKGEAYGLRLAVGSLTSILNEVSVVLEMLDVKRGEDE